MFIIYLELLFLNSLFTFVAQFFYWVVCIFYIMCINSSGVVIILHVRHITEFTC